MSNPICVKCDKPIVPGDLCDMVFSPDVEEGQRIFTEDDMILVHLECPVEDADS